MIWEEIGLALVSKMWDMLKFDVSAYCNAAVDASYEYCIQEFKRACKIAGIEWKKSWEDILYG